MFRSHREEGTAPLVSKGWIAYWGFIAALLAVLAVRDGPSNHSGPEKTEIQNPHSNRTEQEAPKSEPSQAEFLVAPVGAVSPEVKRPVTSHNNSASNAERDQKIRDLSAQEDMALWAKIMGVVAFLTMLITAFGLWLLKRTLGETKRAAEAADKMVIEAEKTTQAAQDAIAENRRIGEFQAKAYLTVISATSRYAGSDMVVGLKIKNSGMTPAYKISVVSQYILKDGKTKTIITAVKPLASQEEEVTDVQWGEFIETVSEDTTSEFRRFTAKTAGVVALPRFWGQIEFCDVFMENPKRSARVIDFAYMGNGSGKLTPSYVEN